MANLLFDILMRSIRNFILDLIPEKVRKAVGWVLLIFGAVAILWGMYADADGLTYTGILNLIALFVGIFSTVWGLILLTHRVTE